MAQGTDTATLRRGAAGVSGRVRYHAFRDRPIRAVDEPHGIDLEAEIAVITIILTIMVLELKVPHGTDWETLRPLIPVLLSYVLSFVFVGIYWNNHHHMLHAVRQVNGGILWANLHLLFWLSLIPFVTR